MNGSQSKKNPNGESSRCLPFWIGTQPIVNESNFIPVHDPATGRLLRCVSAATNEQADEAVRRASETFRSSSWRYLLPHIRAGLLRQLGDAIDADADHLARLQSEENGKVYRQSLQQAKSAAATFRYYAGVCETAESPVTPSRGDYMSYVRYEPCGVVVAITPWNSPLTMEAQKAAPALAAGNCVILKPSEITPSCALRLAELAAGVGFPAGTLTVLPGYGRDMGRALLEHPLVRMVSFTGGTETGRHIGSICSERLIPAALELGGKSPQIVFNDADVDLAVSAIIDGIFEGSGQSCVAGSRLFIQADCYEQVLALLIKKAKELKVGLPFNDGSDLGPLATFDHLAKVSSFVERARSDGARVLCGGYRPDTPELRDGAFYMPTILEGLEHDHYAVQEEIFGPVLSVFKFSDETKMVELANGTNFGLAAGVWTNNSKRALRLAADLESGTVWVNTYKQLSVSTPFGGTKDSGFGREKGIGGLRLYQQTKAVYLSY